MDLSKKLQLCLLTISLFFTTGFFGGEDPEDAVEEIIQALEDNNATLFNTRIPKPYWEAIVTLAQSRDVDRNNPFFRDMNKDRSFERAMMNAMRSRRPQSEAEEKEFFYPIMQEYMGKKVASGELANLSRSASLGILPFAPEFLEALEYGDEGSAELAGIVPAEFTLQNGQKSSLAFVEIDDKWFLLGQGGNKKAAMDMAAKHKAYVVKELQNIAERKKASEQHDEEILPQLKEMEKFIADKDFTEAAKLLLKITNIQYFAGDSLRYTNADKNSTLESEAFWQKIQNTMFDNASVISSMRSDIKGTAETVEAQHQTLVNKDAVYLDLGEILWQEDDIALVRSLSFAKDDAKESFTEEEKRILREKWLNFEALPEHLEILVILKLKDGIWQNEASITFEVDYSKTSDYNSYPVKNIGSVDKFTVEEFMLAYAKRYHDMDAKVQEHLAKQETWKKSLLADINSLNEASRKGDVDILVRHLDMLMIDCDRGNIVTDTQKYVKQKKELASALEAMKNTPQDGYALDIENIEILRITENSATVKEAKFGYLYATRKDLNSPWKVVRQGSTEKELERPANWEEDFAKRVKLIEEQQAAEDKIKQEIKDTLSIINQAVKDKDYATASKHSNMFTLLFDNGDLESLAKNIAENKARAEEMFLENPPSLTDLEKLSFSTINELSVLVLYDGFYSVAERADVNSPWVFMRIGKISLDLLRDPDWMEKVNKRVAEIEEAMAKEAKRKAEIIEAARPQIENSLAQIAKAINDKNLDELQKYVNFYSLTFPIDEKRSVLIKEVVTKISPDFKLKRAVSDVFQGSLPLEKLDTVRPFFDILWNKEAWEKAQIETFQDKDNVFILTLTHSVDKDTEQTPLYALLAQTPDKSYQLIALEKDKSFLLISGSNALNIWNELFRTYTPTEAKAELIKLAHLLKDKNGTEALAFFNFDDIYFWELNNNHKNLNEQAYVNLFPEHSQSNLENENSLASKTLNEINTSGTAFGLGANDLADTVYIPSDKTAFGLITLQGLFSVINDGKGWIIRQVSKDVTDKRRQESYAKQIAHQFKNRQERVLREQNKMEKVFASRTLAKTMLDFVKIENAQFTITQDRSRIALISSFTARNTFSAPIKISQFCYYFQDKNGVNWEMGSFSSHSNNAVGPNNAIKIEDTSHLNAQESYLVEAFKKGEVILLVRPRIIQVNNTYFQLNDTGLKVTKNADDTWGINGFPTVKILETWKDPNQEERDAFSTRFKEAKKQNEIKSMEYAEKIIASVPIRYDSETKSIAITNPFNFDIHFDFSMERLDKGGVILADARSSGRAKANEEVVYKMEDRSKTQKAIPSDEDTLNLQITSLSYQDLNLRRNEQATISSVIPPILYQESPVLFQLTKEEAETFKDRTKIDTPSEKKAEEVKEEAIQTSTTEPPASKDPQVTETSTEQTQVTQEREAVTINENLIAPEPKKPGTAVLLPTTLDKVGLKEIKEDEEKDSHIQVLTKGASPLVAIRLESIGGKAGSWKTKDAKADSMGVILLMQGEKSLNPNNASFEIDVTKPLVLDLFVQDNGALVDPKNRLRVTFFHKDGSRSYAIVKK